mgnify:CR=1 FL=1
MKSLNITDEEEEKEEKEDDNMNNGNFFPNYDNNNNVNNNTSLNMMNILQSDIFHPEVRTILLEPLD